MGITHATAAVGTDSGDDKISKDAWDEAHTVTDITLAEEAAPSTPASGKVVLYAKSDGLLYSKDDAGVETSLVGTAAPVAAAALITAYTLFR